jgi:hypothetical protein
VKKSVADILRSLGLMAVVVAVVVLVGERDLVFPRAADRMPPVDYSSAIQDFGRDTNHPALSPRGLPSSWRANAASIANADQPNERMHVGWALPAQRFAGLDQAVGDPRTALAAVLGSRGLAVRGMQTVAGRAWQVRTSYRGETALTVTLNSVLVIVTGNASDADLRLLAGSLHSP